MCHDKFLQRHLSVLKTLLSVMQKLKLARFNNVEALVKAAEVAPKTSPVIEVRRAARPAVLIVHIIVRLCLQHDLCTAHIGAAIVWGCKKPLPSLLCSCHRAVHPLLSTASSVYHVEHRVLATSRLPTVMSAATRHFDGELNPEDGCAKDEWRCGGRFIGKRQRVLMNILSYHRNKITIWFADMNVHTTSFSEQCGPCVHC